VVIKFFGRSSQQPQNPDTRKAFILHTCRFPNAYKEPLTSTNNCGTLISTSNFDGSTPLGNDCRNIMLDWYIRKAGAYIVQRLTKSGPITRINPQSSSPISSSLACPGNGFEVQMLARQGQSMIVDRTIARLKSQDAGIKTESLQY
jgi:hypothetical protein